MTLLKIDRYTDRLKNQNQKKKNHDHRKPAGYAGRNEQYRWRETTITQPSRRPWVPRTSRAFSPYKLSCTEDSCLGMGPLPASLESLNFTWVTTPSLPHPTVLWQDGVSSFSSKDTKTILSYFLAITNISNTTVLLPCLSRPASPHPNPAPPHPGLLGGLSNCLSASQPATPHHTTTSTSAMTCLSEEQPLGRAPGWWLAGKTAAYMS